jgi:hypothetical protein
LTQANDEIFRERRGYVKRVRVWSIEFFSREDAVALRASQNLLAEMGFFRGIWSFSASEMLWILTEESVV